MELTLFDRLKPYLSKLIAAAIVPLLAWLAQITNIPWFANPENAETVREVIVIWLAATLVHTATSKRTNPSNSASAHLAKDEQVYTASLKATPEPMDDTP